MYIASWADIAPMVCYKVEWNYKLYKWIKYI